MTSESNKKLPLLAPKEVIGIKRRPNRRDLINRNNLQGLPDPDTDIVLRRAVLNVGQAVLKVHQAIIETQPESAMRTSLAVLADPEAPWSDSDWETLTASSAGMESEEERRIEDAFVANVRGVEVGQVEAARRAKPVDVPAFAKKVRAVRGRPTRLTAAVEDDLPSPSRAAAAAAAAEADLPSPCRAAAAAAAAAAASASASAFPFPTVAAPALPLTTMQSSTTRELTTAQAALAFTNSQAGTNVTMDELKTVMSIENDKDTYQWAVGSINSGELTVAEAALVFTNMQAGTNVTMQDLRTAREMVDLWDNEDVYEWTVGNFA